jgi:hypothetical protein
LLQETRDEDPWFLVEEVEHVDVFKAIAECLGRTGRVHAVDRSRLVAQAILACSFIRALISALKLLIAPASLIVPGVSVASATPHAPRG